MLDAAALEAEVGEHPVVELAQRDEPGGDPPTGWGYYLVVNRDSARQRHVVAFVDWLGVVFAGGGETPRSGARGVA